MLAAIGSNCLSNFSGSPLDYLRSVGTTRGRTLTSRHVPFVVASGLRRRALHRRWRRPPADWQSALREQFHGAINRNPHHAVLSDRPNRNCPALSFCFFESCLYCASFAVFQAPVGETFVRPLLTVAGTSSLRGSAPVLDASGSPGLGASCPDAVEEAVHSGQDEVEPPQAPLPGQP